MIMLPMIMLPMTSSYASHDAFHVSFFVSYYGRMFTMANRRKYSREICYQIALGCDSRYHFQQENSTAYRWALKNGWL